MSESPEYRLLDSSLAVASWPPDLVETSCAGGCRVWYGATSSTTTKWPVSKERGGEPPRRFIIVAIINKSLRYSTQAQATFSIHMSHLSRDRVTSFPHQSSPSRGRFVSLDIITRIYKPVEYAILHIRTSACATTRGKKRRSCCFPSVER